MTEQNQAPLILEARGLAKSYTMGHNVIRVLRDVSVSVQTGETVSIMGASGAGKTTLLNVLGGLDSPSGGQVVFKGKDVYGMTARGRCEMRARQVGFVFQSYYLLPELDVLENVMLPAWTLRGALRSMAETRRRALDLLARVGLGERAAHRPAELSGGEQQRAALARALMNEPEVVLADEPTGNLDSATGEQVLHYLFELVKEKGHTLLMVTHNEAVAARCGRVLHLRDGCLETG
ncbi:MAG: ABC transporter ATP-binding protein [Kiritimatiellae bacterium]|nr:ABC transporter ATP-binding protein [Kiritimatiellia bacterium]